MVVEEWKMAKSGSCCALGEERVDLVKNIPMMEETVGGRERMTAWREM